MSLDLYRSSLVMCRYTIPEPLVSPDRHEALVQVFENSVGQIILEHPFLSVGLVGQHSKKPLWVELESVDFRNHVKWQAMAPSVDYEVELLKVIERQVDITFDHVETQPLWRLLVLQVQGGKFLDAIFEWNHAIADGFSIKIFHETLLRSLNTESMDAQRSCLKDRVLAIPSSARNLPPAVDKLSKFTITKKFAAATIWKLLKPPVFATKSDLQANWAPIQAFKPYKTRCRMFSIDNSILQNVLRACRKHYTTLTGLLLSISMVSLATQLPKTDAVGFRGCTAINLRPIMSAAPLRVPGFDPNKTMANFMTIMDHEWDAELVAEIRACVAKVSDNPGDCGP
ncbi:alcohol acetyltransferase-domain-containing protein [Whalleya microplaca]|nr:alcohol acetyltransferase-domain-containing protein [Whalleya microplaca]